MRIFRKKNHPKILSFENKKLVYVPFRGHHSKRYLATSPSIKNMNYWNKKPINVKKSLFILMMHSASDCCWSSWFCFRLSLFLVISGTLMQCCEIYLAPHNYVGATSRCNLYRLEIWSTSNLKTMELLILTFLYVLRPDKIIP
jgi:hypothetical protein